MPRKSNVFPVALPKEDINALDNWRSRNGLGSRSQAIQRALEAAYLKEQEDSVDVR